MIFTQTTDPNFLSGIPKRTAGWTESWYREGGSNAVVASAFGNGGGLLDKRAQLLPATAAITGGRVQQVNPIGPLVTFKRTVPGGAGLACDIPQIALQMEFQSTDGLNVRTLELRGIPDARIVGGSYQPSDRYTTAISNFYQELSSYEFPGIVQTNPRFKIMTISALGVVSLNVANPFAVGQLVRITRSTVNLTGRQKGMNTQVTTTGPGANQFGVAAWPWGESKGGSVRLDQHAFFPVKPTPIADPLATTRKAGRPFGEYRGRVKKAKV
jgi:hypothetical protein